MSCQHEDMDGGAKLAVGWVTEREGPTAPAYGCVCHRVSSGDLVTYLDRAAGWNQDRAGGLISGVDERWDAWTGSCEVLRIGGLLGLK